MPIVRMYGFKLEGGQLFKEGFRKLFSLEWNSLQETRLRIQLAKNKAQNSKVAEKQSVFSQKQSVVYTSKNNNQLNLKSLRKREMHKQFILVHS